MAKSDFHREPDAAMNEVIDIASSPSFVQRHYSVQELAALWNLSHDYVTRMFKHEPGVLALTPKKRRGWRTRTTLRIPEHVAERVYERHLRKAA